MLWISETKKKKLFINWGPRWVRFDIFMELVNTAGGISVHIRAKFNFKNEQIDVATCKRHRSFFLDDTNTQ